MTVDFRRDHSAMPSVSAVVVTSLSGVLSHGVGDVVVCDALSGVSVGDLVTGSPVFAGGVIGLL